MAKVLSTETWIGENIKLFSLYSDSFPIIFSYWMSREYMNTSYVAASVYSLTQQLIEEHSWKSKDQVVQFQSF